MAPSLKVFWNVKSIIPVFHRKFNTQTWTFHRKILFFHILTARCCCRGAPKITHLCFLNATAQSPILCDWHHAWCDVVIGYFSFMPHEATIPNYYACNIVIHMVWVWFQWKFCMYYPIPLYKFSYLRIQCVRKGKRLIGRFSSSMCWLLWEMAKFKQALLLALWVCCFSIIKKFGNENRIFETLEERTIELGTRSIYFFQLFICDYLTLVIVMFVSIHIKIVVANVHYQRRYVKSRHTSSDASDYARHTHNRAINNVPEGTFCTIVNT